MRIHHGLAAGLLVGGAVARAAVLHVAPGGLHVPPYGDWSLAATSVAAAVELAVDGDTILVTNGFYGLGGTLRVTQGVAIRSVNGAAATVLDGAETNRSVSLAHAQAVLDGFTVQNCRGFIGGGVFLDLGAALLNSVVVSNKASLYSGGVHANLDAVITNCVIAHNEALAGGDGGGVFALRGVCIESCTIVSNRARVGGGVALHFLSLLSNCVVQGNTALQGGGVHAGPGSRVLDCTVSGNTAEGGGGVNLFLGPELAGGSVTGNTAVRGADVLEQTAPTVTPVWHGSAAPGGPAGAVWIVATNGDDAADGLSTSTPFRTVARAVQALKPGDAVRVREGVYREYVVLRNAGTAGAPVRVEAWPGEVAAMRGSEVVTNWMLHTNAIWKVDDWPMAPQQVFDGGQPLRMTDWPNAYMRDYARYFFQHTNFGGVSMMTNGTFHYDATGRVLYVWRGSGAAPGPEGLEVAVRPQVFVGATSPAHLALSGLIFEHANSFTYSGGGWNAVVLQGPAVASNCVVRWNDASGLALALDVTTEFCTVSQNGEVGMSFGSNCVVRSCLIASNNYRGFNPFHHAGGMKIHPGACPALGAAGGVVEDSEIAWNRGYGIWFDYATGFARRILRRNYFHDNEQAAIMLEITREADVHDNLIVSNRGGGIHLSHSSATRIWNNTFAGNSGVVDVYFLDMARVACDFGTNKLWTVVESNRFFNNIIYDSRCTYDIVIPSVQDLTNRVVRENTADYNVYHRPGRPLRLGQSGVAWWTNLAEYAAYTGQEGNSLAVPPVFAGAGSHPWMPAAASPAVDSGAEPPVPLGGDVRGALRPQDGDGNGSAVRDRGAYERPAAAADADGDGAYDLEELAEGVDPDDAAAFLVRFRAAGEPVSGGVPVAWSSGTGQVYTVFHSQALATGFGPFVQHLPAQPALTVYTNPAPGTVDFYRVQVEQE